MKAAMNQYADTFLSLPECSENILELFVFEADCWLDMVALLRLT